MYKNYYVNWFYNNKIKVKNLSKILTEKLICNVSEYKIQDIKMASLEMELEQGEESLGDDILNLSTADIQARTRLLDNEVFILWEWDI